MKIALIGYGKMGKMVEQQALAQGHTIIARIDSKWPHSSIAEADVCIDFSQPKAALDNINVAATMKKNIIMGTTGWYDQLDQAKHLVEGAGIGFLYAPNFSLGVALFLNIITQTSSLMAPFNGYDVSGLEIHHNEKLDSPSGTAKKIIEQISGHRPDKKIEFASVRVGAAPGTHSIMFDSHADTITLTHTARNREGFASGALTAATWLQGKTGFFTLDDMLAELLTQRKFTYASA